MTVGSQIEVREGDTWSKVKVVAVEGRRVQVRYDDGTEEWIGPDRLRPGAGGPGADAPSTELPAVSSASAPCAASRAFAVSQAVEIKRSGKWHAAQVRELSKGWLLVAEDGGNHEKRWIEPWDIRVPGSAYDIDSGGTESWPAQLGQVAPQKPPAKSPPSSGDPFTVVPEDQRPVTADDLTTKFETVSFDNAHESVPTTQPSARIPTSQPAGEFAAWPLHGPNLRLGAILTCPGNSKIAVASFPGTFDRPTVVIRTNLLSHAQLDTRSLHIPDIHVMAAANDGDLLMTTFDWDKKLQLWKWDGHGYKLALNLQVDPDSFAHISYSEFVSPDRAIVGSTGGSIYLLDLDRKHVLASTKSVKTAAIYLHPSGQLLGVITPSNTALILNTSDFSTVAEFPDAGNTSNVSIDPTGQFAAYPTSTGVVRIVKIADKTELGTVAVGAAFKGTIDLVDDKFLLIDHSVAYDVKSGIPIWLYKMPREVLARPLANGQFILAAPGNNMASIAVVSIPDQVGRSAMKSANAAKFLLKPGAAIKVDADFGPFGEDRDKAAANVNEVIKSAGMTVSENDEAFHLTMSLASGPTQKRDYAPGFFVNPHDRVIQTVDVPSNILTATLNYKGAPVWSQTIGFSAGDYIQRDEKRSFQDVANDAAKPRADALKDLHLPSYLPAGAKPGEPAALGSSVLQDRRFVPEKDPAPVRKTH